MREAELVQPVYGNIFTRIARVVWSKTLVRAVLFGVVSISAYLLLFLNEETITEHFSRGGVYTLAVVGTAVAFSLIHGTFANYILELVGIRAKDSH
jgi:hypothetical protein